MDHTVNNALSQHSAGESETSSTTVVANASVTASTEPRKFSTYNPNSSKKSTRQIYRYYSEGRGFNSGSPDRKSG